MKLKLNTLILLSSTHESKRGFYCTQTARILIQYGRNSFSETSIPIQLMWFLGGRTKQPILKTRQNSRFWKRDKIADFGNGTKRPISKKRQNRRFWSGTKQPISKKRQNRRFWSGTKQPISKKRQNRRFWSGTKQPISKKRQNRRFFFCLYINFN